MFDRLFDLQLFAEGAEGGQGGGSGGQGGGTGGTGGAAGAGGQGGEGGQGGTDKPYAVFPDERSLMTRIGRETKKAMEDKAKALGFESVDAMEVALKAAKDRSEAEKTELQKEKEARAQAEAKGQEALKAANDRLLRAEFKALAAAKGFANPDDAYMLADRSGVEVKDDGAVAGAAEAVEALAKARPYLIGKGGGAPVGSGTNPGGAGGNETPTFTREQLKGMTPEQINANWDAIQKQMAAGTLK